jgi:enoyl-CoA hydratase
MDGPMTLVDLDIRSLTDGHRSRIAVATLNDPSRRNALSSALVADLLQAIDAAESSPDVGAIVFTGAGPAFCAGADLGKLAGDSSQKRSAEVAEEDLRSIYAAFIRVAECSLPTIAAINGPVVGAGLNLALACDVAIAVKSVKFESRFVRLGLHPGGGHTYLLQRTAGRQIANALALFGQTLSADEAVTRGLIWRSVEEDQLMDTALSMANAAVEVPRDLTTRIKQSIEATASAATYAESVDIELLPQLWSLEHPFFVERLAQLRSQISSTLPTVTSREGAERE